MLTRRNNVDGENGLCNMRRLPRLPKRLKFSATSRMMWRLHLLWADDMKPICTNARAVYEGNLRVKAGMYSPDIDDALVNSTIQSSVKATPPGGTSRWIP